MKTATLIAAIAVAIEMAGRLYYLLINYDLLQYDKEINKIVQPLFLLSSLGMLFFFIKLYQKQSK